MYFRTYVAATLTEAAGYGLTSWLEFAGKSLNPGLVSAFCIERRLELGRNSSLRQSEWLWLAPEKQLTFLWQGVYFFQSPTRCIKIPEGAGSRNGGSVAKPPMRESRSLSDLTVRSENSQGVNQIRLSNEANSWAYLTSSIS